LTTLKLYYNTCVTGRSIYHRNQDSTVSVTTRLQVGWSRNHNFIPRKDKIFPSSPQRPNQLWGPPSLKYKWAGGALTRGREIKPTTHLQPVLKLKIGEAIPALPHDSMACIERTSRYLTLTLYHTMTILYTVKPLAIVSKRTKKALNT
jgi:hypothetical protein